VPIHYGTYGLLKGTPEAFKAALGDHRVEVTVVEPGQSLSF
jgi:L-ascorbate metabolism protein UlaG (beta-lactamase superfamily)